MADAPVRIDRGRQLFVDDFLVEESTLQRSFHRPALNPASPVFVPQTPLELNDGVMPAAAMPSVAFDPDDGLYKMWYLAGYDDALAYAESEDGIEWRRPTLDVVPGTNRVLAPLEGYIRNNATVCLDHEAASRAERFKMFIFFRAGTGAWPREQPQPAPAEEEVAFLFTSPDGIHWTRRARAGPCGDNTSLFRNPFRGTWAYSIRTFGGVRGRLRSYYEHSEFVAGAPWHAEDVREWLAADERDRPDPELGLRPELYKVDCVAYESVMLGLFGLYKGPPNHVVSGEGIPKTVDLFTGFSRDGLAWERPDRTPFLACSRRPGTWDRGYLYAAGGVCLVVGDELRFYFSGFSGVSPAQGGGPYAGGSTGLATLRRDGFASMDGLGIPMPPVTRTGARDKAAAGMPPGMLTTRAVTFSGSHLFVNARVRGTLAVEVLAADGTPLPGFAAAACMPVSGDSTRHRVAWKERELARLAGQPVRFRFLLDSGELFAFWVSASADGASGGYVGAGGLGFTSGRDTGTAG